MADDRHGTTGGESGVGSGNMDEDRRAGQSRGERDDEAANGGRDSASVSPDDDEIAEEQQAHQDRGQSDVEFEHEPS